MFDIWNVKRDVPLGVDAVGCRKVEDAELRDDIGIAPLDREVAVDAGELLPGVEPSIAEPELPLATIEIGSQLGAKHGRRCACEYSTLARGRGGDCEHRQEQRGGEHGGGSR